MPTPLEKFQSLLRELFQFEQADLDFGVYRIMNLRRERMDKWLNEELPVRARDILTHGGTTADDDLGSRLEVVKVQLLEMDPGGIDEDGNIVNDALKDIAKGKEYLKLKAQHDRAPARTAANMEPLVYNHLYDFFSRYYDTGDFIPKRRRSFAPDGRDTYAIPWDGEEVVLHWANKDQYYIKTGERFTHYRWQTDVGGRSFTIEFHLTDADLPANNNKDAKKKFNLLIADKVEWQEDKATLILPFHYRGLTPEEEAQLIGTQEAKLRESIIKRTVGTVRELPVVSGVQHLVTALMASKRDAAGQEKRDKDGNAVPLLPYHLNRWAVKNESDYFIHKDLRRFLTGELDYFLKSVVLNLDNLLAAGEQRAEPNFRLLDAVKRLGTEIIDFVSQLEDFQKALFEKKKFVLETSWCFTLDRIPASVKEEVYAAILASDRQWEEWETLYKISKWPVGHATAAPRTREFLDAYPYLMLDTGLKKVDGTDAYLSAMIERFLAEVTDIDEAANGTIIHSENFQAVTLLQEYLNEAVQCIYIDPPYNTSENAFTYKNAYKHSSWLAMVEPVIRQAHPLVREEGAILAAIDDTEYSTLRNALARNFGERNYAGSIAAEVNPAGQNIRPNVPARSHDYFHIFTKDIDNAEMTTRELTEEEIATYSLEDERGKYLWDNLRRRGGNSRPSDRPKQWYPIYRNETALRVPSMEWNLGQKKYVILEPTAEDEVEEWPKDPHGEPRIWRTNPKGARDGIAKGDIQVIQKASRWEVSKKSRIPKGKKPKTLWKDGRHSATTFGTKLLTNILGANFGFSYPKSLHLVSDAISNWVADDSLILDYFGGSGTTGHAVVALNRGDDGTRKYILVEMGRYFDTVLKPRLQKIVFSEDWKTTVPKAQTNPNDPSNPNNGVSHCLKVLRLESYEDALDNIEFNTADAPSGELGLDFRRDYELRYALDWESRDCPTRLAVEQLDTPFDYTLTLRRETGTVAVKPDLPETFAYLIGLHTRRRFRTVRNGVSYLIYTGTLHEDGTEVAVLWRTCKGWKEANLKTEMDWWREQREMLAPGATRIYVNGASAIEGHHSLDAVFKNRMHGGTF